MTLTACEGLWGDKEKAQLPGKRVAVLSFDKTLAAEAGGGEIRLPRPVINASWPQAGGYPHHAMHHVEAGEQLAKAWSSDVGAGSSDRSRLVSPPVVAEGKAFVIDAEGGVTAVDARTGARVWQVSVAPDEEDGDGNVGGGVSYEDGRLFVATGYGQVVALKADSGAELWRRSVSAPVRGAPAVRGGRVVVQAVDNQTHALAADDGRPLWRHAGIGEVASLLGGSSPAIDGNVVVVAYSSGEVVAMRVENGAVLWTDSLSSLRRTDSLSILTDIRGLPVIGGERVFAIGNSDTLTAIDLRSGRRLWEREIGGTQTPWLAGEYLYVISNEQEVVALDAKTGRILWVVPLQRWTDTKARTGYVTWTGPVLAGDRLIVTSSHGWALSVSPYSGRVIGKETLPEGIVTAPVVADRAVYFLTEDAELVAYR